MGEMRRGIADEKARVVMGWEGEASKRPSMALVYLAVAL